MNHLTAAEIAAFLGITATAVRQVIRRKGITHTGKQGRAHLYNPADILRHTGTQDRQTP